LSLGVQSWDDAFLTLLGRVHSAAQARQSIADARAAGFDNLSLDLMYGLPGQTLAGWQEDLRLALDLVPEHLSLYALTVEEHTPLAEWIACGAIPAPDDDLAADMYEWAEDALARAGYVHYEISNWARPGRACRHNLVYWRNEPYIGLGAGAHSWWAGQRWANEPLPDHYVRALKRGELPVAEREDIGTELEMAETMMMGLRLLQEGVSLDRFQRRFGASLERVYAEPVAELVDRGLIELTPRRIRLTPPGRLLGNQVFARFL
jgi:oxygen-independent coproporphyrinogen-3 oxidase